MKSAALCLACLLPLLAAADARSDDEAAREILGRALGPTPIVADLQQLTDDIGGRPTGTAALNEAVDWGIDKFRRAGLDNVRAEPYTAALLWVPGAETGQVTAPATRILRIAALPSTSGTGPAGIEAEVAAVGHGDEADFAAAKDKLRGRWALVGTEPMKNFEDLDNEYRIGRRIFEEARAAGAVGVLWTSTHPGRLLYRHPIRFNETVDPLPGAMLEREEALRIGRLLASGRTVRLKIVTTPQLLENIRVANVVGELRGATKPDEFVVLGAHLDSWDLGTGALDNGCNAALVIDAARQMAAVAKAHRPARTIRFILFTGEEAGFLGSLADLRQHRNDLDRVVAMITVDGGTSRTTGFSTGGRADLVAAADAALASVQAFGPFTQTTDAFVGTDNYDYLVEGVPNFVANQDADTYLPYYHASSDTFDKVDVRDLKINTAIAAVFTWNLANASTVPGPRQTRAEIESLIKATDLERSMRAWGMWDTFVSGTRGRAP